MGNSAGDQHFLAGFWNDAWTTGLWAAGWGKSLEGLTAQQAAWSPPSAEGAGPGQKLRNSIWQNVLHMCFWREDALRRLTDEAKPSETAVAAGNWPEISDRSEAAWSATKGRFAKSQGDIAAALTRPEVDLARLRFVLPHDCYHFGQINYIRGLLGLPAIE